MSHLRLATIIIVFIIKNEQNVNKYKVSTV